MGLRYTDMAHLKKSISPDVEIDYGDAPAPHTKAAQKVEAAKQEIAVLYDSLEDKFYRRWLELGGKELVREFRFHETRKWRFDFALIQTNLKCLPVRVAFEIQGGIYEAQSGHRSFSGVQTRLRKV